MGIYISDGYAADYSNEDLVEAYPLEGRRIQKQIRKVLEARFDEAEEISDCETSNFLYPYMQDFFGFAAA